MAASTTHENARMDDGAQVYASRLYEYVICLLAAFSIEEYPRASLFYHVHH